MPYLRAQRESQQRPKRNAFALRAPIACLIGVLCLWIWPSPGASQRPDPILVNPQQPPTWSSSGPDGASVTALLIDKNQTSHIYMTSGATGVLESADGGASWRLIRKNEGQEFARTLALDYLTGTLFVGTTTGISRSTDGGKSWNDATIPNLDPSQPVLALAADPSQPCTVFAGANGLYKTSDCGSSWSRISLGVFSNVLLIDPTDPKFLYCANGGVIRSVNGGFNWAPQDKGLDSGVLSLAIDPVSPSTLYATTANFFCQLFKSTDRGATWSQLCLTDDLDRIVTGFGVGSGILYAATISKGVFRSLDGGKTWISASAGLGALPGFFSPIYAHPYAVPYIYVPVLAVDPVSPLTVYSGSIGAGVFKTIDGGDSWSWASAGTNGSDVHSISVDPSSPDVLYAAAGIAGLFRSMNGGKSWTQLQAGIVDRKLNAVAVDPTNPSIVYSATEGGHVFKSSDRGQTFVNMSAGLPNGPISNIVIDRSRPSTIYATAAPNYSVTNSPGGVYKTTDGGVSWSRASTGLASPVTITSFVMSPTSSSFLYLTTYGNGIFRSINGGRGWTPIGPSTYQYVRSLAVDPSSPNRLYAGIGVGPQPVWKSTNGGSSWSAAGDGLPEDSWIVSLQVDPLDRLTIYAGTELHGAYRSTDGGGSWAPFNTGIENRNITVFAVHPLNSDRVYTGSIGGGVFHQRAEGLPVIPPR